MNLTRPPGRCKSNYDYQHGVHRQQRLPLVRGRGLGPQYEGYLFVGGARPFLEGEHLFHFNLTGNRRKIGIDDPRLEDRVADNLCKFDVTESESLLIGRNFGTLTDIVSLPNGNLFLVSIDKGTVFEIFLRS